MTIQSEPNWAGEAFVDFVERSFEQCTVLSGQNLLPGAVVGLVRYGIGRVSIPTVVNAEGSSANGTVSGVTAGPDVQEGSYVATCTAAATDAGTFGVVAPDGTALPDATVGVAYTSRHLNFTINDGGTDFKVGDKFTFVVDGTAPTVLGGTGTGTISELVLGPDAKPGNYHFALIEAITNGGRWQVFGPDGDALGEFLQSAGSTNKTVFPDTQLGFSITDATDFIVGNTFDVAVFNKVTKKVAAWSARPTTFDGRQKVAGVLRYGVDASSGDTAGVMCVRLATVHAGKLAWLATVSAAEKVSAQAELDKLGIVVAAAA